MFEIWRLGFMNCLANDFVVIDKESHPGSKIFRFTPSICVTKSGRYIFSNELRTKDHPGSAEDTPHYDEILPNPFKGTNHVGQIFISDDKGETWRYVCSRNFSQQRVFEADGVLYLLGHSDDLVIYRSLDNGETWDDGHWLTKGKFWHQSACNMWIENGYINLTMEERWVNEGEVVSGWNISCLAPVLLRAKLSDDLTKVENWTFSDRIRFRDMIDENSLDLFGFPFFPTNLQKAEHPDAKYFQPQCGWLESNVVRITDPNHYWYDPTGNTLHIIMRMHTGGTGYCAVMRAVISEENGKETIKILPQTNPSGRRAVFLPLPGGQNRFHVLWDEPSQLFWLVSVQSIDSMTRTECLSKNRYNIGYDERHRLQLHFSKNLVDWCFAGMLCIGPTERHSRHYTSVAVDGDDLVFVSRTSDENADSAHNNNMNTFHRVKNFRDLVY